MTDRYSKQYADRVATGLSAAMQVDPDRREEPGVWSLKDLLGHLAYWDGVTRARLEAEQSGREFRQDPREDDPVNGEQSGARADWSWDQVLAEPTSNRDRVVGLLKQPSRYDLADLGGHWVEHTEQILAWLKQNQPETIGEPA